MTGSQGLAEVVADEQARVAAGESACGHACTDHGGHTCTRVRHSGDIVHVGHDGEQLVQWIGNCCEPTP